MINLISPKRPTGPGWRQLPAPPAWATLGYASSAWFHGESNLAVISAVEVAKDADNIDRGPEYHVSISKQIPGSSTGRCSSADALWVIAQFGLTDAEEDNHVPSGKVRNFWRPVADKLVGLECACKEQETAIREDKGDYIWRGANK